LEGGDKVFLIGGKISLMSSDFTLETLCKNKIHNASDFGNCMHLEIDMYISYENGNARYFCGAVPLKTALR
jgi:hypothetical protein